MTFYAAAKRPKHNVSAAGYAALRRRHYVSTCPSRCLSRANVGSPAERAALAIASRAASHHGRRPTPCSISVQKWNSPQGGQVHCTDAAKGASNDRERSLGSYLRVLLPWGLLPNEASASQKYRQNTGKTLTKMYAKLWIIRAHS